MRHDPDAMPDGMRCDPDAVPENTRRDPAPMRDDMRHHPAHPARPLGKNAEKLLKKGPKGAKMRQKWVKKSIIGYQEVSLRNCAASCGQRREVRQRAAVTMAWSWDRAVALSSLITR